MKPITLPLLLLIFLSICGLSRAYLPGVHSNGYFEGEEIPLKVNSLTSIHTQLPYLYYSLPFCRPSKVVDVAENLGEILLGDRLENSPYEINAGETAKCKTLCRVMTKKEDLKVLTDRIREEYRVHWVLDNIPAVTPHFLVDSAGQAKAFYEEGFLLGRKAAPADPSDPTSLPLTYLHNHVSLKILYSRDKEDSTYHIVGLEIDPQSVQHPSNKEPSLCPEYGRPIEALPQPVHNEQDTLITYTYSVHWEERDVKWASRLDVYSRMLGNQIHWFSIVNSLLIILFLTGLIALILLRTLRSDLLRYKELEVNEEDADETGWKLLHGDVFRPPKMKLLLSSLVGSGVQVFGMTVITLAFATIGFLSPENRGSILTAMIVLFVLMGLFAGYFSARTYHLCNGTRPKVNAIITALLFPGIVFVIFLILNAVLVTHGSSGAVPFGTLLVLIALWFGVSVPLVFLGNHFGARRLPDEQKVTVNPIPREIPELSWYTNPVIIYFLGGILPFGAVFIELFFILSSLWLHEFYYVFGFLAIVFVILVITSGEIAVVLCYFHLCNEDYHWWWKAFLTPATSGVYLLVYATYYFWTKLQVTRVVSVVLYFGYSLIMGFGLFVLTGFVGFWSCLYFVTKIYNSIKTD